MTGPVAPPTSPSSPDDAALADRLRRGLREAAADLPTGDAAYGYVLVPQDEEGPAHDRGRGPLGAVGTGAAGHASPRIVRRAPFGRPGIAPMRARRQSVALVAAVAVLAGAVGFATRWATEPSSPGTSADGADASAPGADGAGGADGGTAAPIGDALARDASGDEARLTPGMGTAGRARVVGHQLMTYTTDGTPLGGRSLAPLGQVVAITSDTEGGWVACDADHPAPVWFPANALPVALDVHVECVPDALAVARSDDGVPALVYVDRRSGEGRWRLAARALDADRPGDGDVDLGIEGLPASWAVWSASPDGVVAEGPDGIVLLGLDGAVVPDAIEPGGGTAALRVATTSDWPFTRLVTTVAGVVVHLDGSSEVVVWDAATGEERWSEAVAADGADVDLAYDGERVAFTGAGGVIEVVDLRSGERHTLDDAIGPALLP
jgi:hypothetical protein